MPCPVFAIACGNCLVGGFAAEVVDALHCRRVVADAGDFERLFWRDENRVSLGDASVDVCEGVVVPDVARLERLVDRGITAEERLGERDALSREFAVSPRAGRYHHVPGEAERLEVFERNPVRKSAVEIAASVDLHRLRDERH